jgi:hypothetical protein
MPQNITALNLGTQNTPNNTYNVAPAGSSYASTYAGVTTTILVGQSINPDIIHEWNKEYTSTLFLMSLARKGRSRREWNWTASPYMNAPVEVRATAALVAPSAGGAEQTIPITDLSWKYVGKNDKVMYPGDGFVHAIVIAKSAFSAGACTITVRAGQGKGLPQVTSGQILGNAGNHRADGKSSIDTVQDPELVTYSNIMEDVGDFAVRFDPDEMLELRNTQQVDIIGNKIKTVYDKFMSSIQQRFFMSQYERFTLADGETSTATRGFLAQQADAGVGVIDVTTANATDILRQAMFDIQLSGSEDLVLAGTGRSLSHFGLGEKSERLRYGVGDKTYNMDMTKYEFWGHSVTPMRVDVWEDRGAYGNVMANDLVLFRKSDINLTYLNGKPMISRKHTLQNRSDNPASIYDLNLMWYNATFGVEGHRMAFTRRLRLNY